jgi:biopolymer transport protein ExbB
MLIVELLAAAADAAPQNKFGFAEALEQGGFIAYATVVILGIMSFGSFYILFTKWSNSPSCCASTANCALRSGGAPT